MPVASASTADRTWAPWLETSKPPPRGSGAARRMRPTGSGSAMYSGVRSRSSPAKAAVIVSSSRKVVSATSGRMSAAWSGSSSPSVASSPAMSPSSMAMPTSADRMLSVADSMSQ